MKRCSQTKETEKERPIEDYQAQDTSCRPMPSPAAPLAKEGDEYRGFVVTRSSPIEELQMHLLELTHIATGANVMHLMADDPENAFCLSFKTLPESSNGVAHILEHTILCGSEKFPLHDPFFCMLRRSLHTFMNAFTGSDFTCYPAASQIPTDFYNLLEVYIDAVFYPRLTKQSFEQEGHRLELASSEDLLGDLAFKGVVYNEMKGSMASPMSRVIEKLNALLYPTITYGHNSGGQPKKILTLTHEELLAFYRSHYHPSRCLFYFYGSWPLVDHLDFIAEHVLEKTKERQEPLPSVPKERRKVLPEAESVFYPATEEEDESKHTIVTIGWLTCPIQDQQTLLGLFLLDILLMGTDAAPLKRGLLDSGLCKQVSLSIDPDNSEIPMIMVMKGCNSSQVAQLEDKMLSLLEQISKTGFDQKSIDSALHQLEFHRCEIGGGRESFGIELFMRAGLLKQHGADPLASLQIHTLFAQLRKKMQEDPRYLSTLLEKYLLHNGHRVRVTGLPDSELVVRELAEEQATLERLGQQKGEKERKAIQQQMEAFSLFQESQEEQDREILPKLQIDQIPLKSRDYPLSYLTDGEMELFFHDVFTNDIVYASYILPLPHFEVGELPYLALLLTIISQMGAGDRSFKETLDYHLAYIGGISPNVSLYGSSSDVSLLTGSLWLKGKALYRNADKLFKLFVDMARKIDFDDRLRLQELIGKQWISLQSSLIQGGMHYARNQAASSMHCEGVLNYWWNGLGYFYTIKSIAENLPNNLPSLIEKLKELHLRVFHGNSPHLVISCDNKFFSQIESNHFYGLGSLEKRPFIGFSHNHYQIDHLGSQGWILPSEVSFSCALLRGPAYRDPSAAALSAAAMLMDNVILHRRIREEGGAYGSGAVCMPMDGLFQLYAYRDPNISSTWAAFLEAIDRIGAGDFEDELLYEAKLEMLQDLDAPVKPGSRGAQAYAWWRTGKPLAVRQQFRQRLLALTKQEVMAAVAHHLLPQTQQMLFVTFAGQTLLEKENEKLIALGKKPLTLFSIV